MCTGQTQLSSGICKQNLKPQTNYHCCLCVRYLVPYCLILITQQHSINISGVHGFVSFTVNVLNNLTREPYSFPDIHTDPKDTVKRTTLQPKITF